MFRAVRAAREDYRTAVEDLDATEEQALAVAVMACAWRLSVVSAAGGLLALAAAGAAGALSWASRWIVLAILAPLLLGFVVSLPLACAGALHAFGHDVSRDARLRFGNGGSVYVYYGWRYAFRGRRRPWGAMTHEERIAVNPDRLDVD